MASFSASSFDATNYESYRPSYPPALYDVIIAYHASGQLGTCVDLGCGTGKSTRALAERFDRVIGVDPGEPMVATARKEGDKTKAGEEIEWVVAASDRLGFLKDESVDVVTAATAPQYFKYPETWHEIARVLKPHGTVAFFTYTMLRLGQPLTALNPIADHWSAVINGRGPNHVPDFLGSLAPPEDLFDKKDETRHIYVGEHYPSKHFEEREDVILKVTRTWEQLEGFFRSGGATFKYFETHPEDKQNPEGDAVTRMVKELKEEAEKMGYKGNEIVVEHPMALVLLRKAS